MEHNLDRFQKETFTFPGNYRATVEDNQDPLGIGRVRIRIFGIHSPNALETPVDHLPWAEPCLSMYYSGGGNLENTNKTLGPRYSPNGGIFIPPNRNTETLTDTFQDSVMKNSGSGGFFTVPRKGTMVWIFFEAENHNRPHYWGIAPKKIDWEKQRDKNISDIKKKIEEITALRNKFTPDNTDHVASGPSKNIKVKSFTNKPKMAIQNITDSPNHEITSFTSPGGVNYIIVNKDGKERTYIIHKGHMEYTDENGQRRVLVGTTNGKDNDMEQLIGNNYELHINGDFDTFVNKSSFVQIEGDSQIIVNGNVGIVSKNGDIDLSAEKGSINMYAKKKINITSDANMQLQCNKDMIVEVKNNLSEKIGMNHDHKVTMNLRIGCLQYNMKASTTASLTSGVKFSIKTGALLGIRSDGLCGIQSTIMAIKGQAIANYDGALINLQGALVNAGGMVLMGAAVPAVPAVADPAIPPTTVEFDTAPTASKTQKENPVNF